MDYALQKTDFDRDEMLHCWNHQRHDDRHREDDTDVITLDGRHYFQRRMHYQPIAVPPPTNALTATNAIDRQFQKMFLTRYKRRPIRIQGEGTLKCPDIDFCEVHLDSGVTFITSGRFKPDGCNFKDSVPPPDANWNNHIGYPAYVVEPGAKLIFTENDAYPPALVRHSDSNL